MEDKNLINFLNENSIDIPKNIKFGVVNLPSNLFVGDKISDSKKQQFHAGMKFTFSKPEFSGLGDKFNWSKTAIVLALSYKNNIKISSTTKPGYGHIAGFAQQDYYLPLKKFISEIEEVFSKYDFRSTSFVDSPSHYDRLFFENSGLGWQGKSTMMLTPVTGPWQLLGTIYVDQIFESTQQGSFSCGNCNLCQISCPTGALNNEYVLDSRKCISYWLQSPEIVPYDIRIAIGNKFYGCDDCLTSCPPGQDRNLLTISNSKQNINLESIILSNDDELLNKYYWFYIPKRNPIYLKRNAIIALANNPNKNTLNFFLDAYLLLDIELRKYLLWGFWRLSNLSSVKELIIKYDFNNQEIIDEYEKLKGMIS